MSDGGAPVAKQDCYTVGLAGWPVGQLLLARFLDSPQYAALRAAVADGPVSDTPEPVTPQAGIVGLDADWDDGDTVGHTR